MSAGLFVQCDCSLRIPVTPAKCGCMVLCGCGKQVQVPALGELRSKAGLPECKADPIHRVEWLDANGQLPLETDCVACGSATAAFLACTVQYEAKSYRILDLLPKPLLYFCAPIWFVPLMRRSMELQDAAAEDRFIEIRIRLCEPCLDDLPRDKQALRTIAGSTELYAELFREYPLATIRGVRRK